MLTQAEADWLISIPKEVQGRRVRLPGPGSKVNIVVLGKEAGPTGRKERFYLDISRGRRERDTKFTLQLRGRHTIRLVRLDVGGGGHKNPPQSPNRTLHPLEGETIQPPQLHRYVEGFHDRWAEPAPPHFTNPSNLATTWVEFLAYCNIEGPVPQGGLI